MNAALNKILDEDRIGLVEEILTERLYLADVEWTPAVVRLLPKWRSRLHDLQREIKSEEGALRHLRLKIQAAEFLFPELRKEAEEV